MYRKTLGMMLAGVVGAASAVTLEAGFDGGAVAGDVFLVDSNGGVQWFKGTGDELTVSHVSTVTHGATALAAGPFTGDGVNDLFVSMEGDSTNWYRSDGTPGGINWKSAPIGGDLSSMSIGDLEGNGLGDLWTVNAAGQVQQYVSDPSTSGGISWRRTLTDGSAVGAGQFGGGDFGDVFVSTASTLNWYRGTGPDSAIGWTAGYSALAGVQDIAIGDVTGNGTGDLLVVKADGEVNWYESNGVGANPSLMQTFSSDATSVALGDLDGNGMTDVLVGRSASAVEWYTLGTSGILELQGQATTFGSVGVQDMVIISAVPEPGTLGLLALAAGVSLCRRPGTARRSA